MSDKIDNTITGTLWMAALVLGLFLFSAGCFVTYGLLEVAAAIDRHGASPTAEAGMP